MKHLLIVLFLVIYGCSACPPPEPDTEECKSWNIACRVRNWRAKGNYRKAQAKCYKDKGVEKVEDANEKLDDFLEEE